jgi:glucokinase
MTDQRKKTGVLPLEFPRTPHGSDDDIIVVAGDIGGTKTNLAMYKSTAAGMKELRQQGFASRDFKSFEEIIRIFLDHEDARRADRICLGVAGPVMNARVQTTNLAWNLDAAAIASETGILRVALINDLEATSYGLAGLQETELVTVHQASSLLPGCAAVIAPGTGLGEAGLFWTGSGYIPFATEGGHSEFFPRDSMDLDLYGWLVEKYGVVSWERLISGPGLTNIYGFLKEALHRQEPPWLAAEVQGADAGAVITRHGLAGDVPICQEALRMFVRFLAHESTSLVLKYKATGGLFLAGGIPPRLVSLIGSPELFYSHFLKSDRMEDLLEKVTIRVIMNPDCALIGAAYYGAYGVTEQG